MRKARNHPLVLVLITRLLYAIVELVAFYHNVTVPDALYYLAYFLPPIGWLISVFVSIYRGNDDNDAGILSMDYTTYIIIVALFIYIKSHSL
jgi:hypothetical protein